jgi:4-hydroxy-tetrahydrodipicolinate reductase
VSAIRVLVAGAKGRMGALTCETIHRSEGLALVGGCARGDDLRAAIATTRADVVVDFTLPDVVRANALAIVEAGARPVIGTSGLTAAAREELAAACARRRLGGVVAPNFAIGAVLMMRFAELAARHLREVEIQEAHHPGKKDAPSGTAIATAEAIARGRAAAGGGGKDSKSASKSDPPSSSAPVATPAARGHLHAGVPIHSTRLPGILAEQSVVFGELGQKLVVEHVAYGREAYMPGVVLACRRVVALDRLVVGLDALLFGE